jgi:hypothetical protein
MSTLRGGRQYPNLDQLKLPPALVKAVRSAYQLIYDLRDAVPVIAPVPPPTPTTLPTENCFVWASVLGLVGMASGVATAINFDQSDYDNGGFITTPSTKLTFPVDGLYVIAAVGSMAAENAGTYRRYKIRLNGTTDLAEHTISLASFFGTVEFDLPVSVVYKATAGDYVELYGQQDSGSIVQDVGGRAVSNMTIGRVQ